MLGAKVGGQLRLLVLGLLAILASSLTEGPAVRVLFLTDCSPYSDWQSIGMVYSYMYSGHNGPITRVMCCSEDDRLTYNPELLGLVETHIAPSYASDPVTGDYYVPYNKPGAVIDYLEHVTPAEEWLLVLDSDMIIRKPWRVQDFNISLGWASGYSYRYLKGVHNDLADRHIPEIPKRNDTFAGPVGRRSDMVGGFFFIHRSDLKRVSKLWLEYTADVRADSEAYHLTGDVAATKRGQKPWIAEMYGYSFGAAKANVWHHWDEHAMMYPGNSPGGIPKVLHYGLEWEVQGYKFDKHWYWKFDPMKCPPWDLTPQRPKHGLFPHPPRPSELTSKRLPARYLDLISVEGVATLNAGLCFWYRRSCPSTPQLEQECDKAEAIFFETREALRAVEAAYGCLNHQVMCETWAARGECQAAEKYMSFNCRPACKLCSTATVAIFKEVSASESTLLYTISHPKGEVMRAQPITGASSQFIINPPASTTTPATTAADAFAHAHVANTPPTDEPTTDEPTTDEPTTDEPTTDEPTTDEPTTDEPTTDEPSTDEPTTDDPTTDEPTTDKPTTDEPTTAPTTTAPTTTTPTTPQVTTPAIGGPARVASRTHDAEQTETTRAPFKRRRVLPMPATPLESPVPQRHPITTTTPTPTPTTPQHRKQMQDHTANSGSGAQQANSTLVHQLLKRCYHLGSMSIDEVKDCMTRAKRGERWTQAPASPKVPAAGGGGRASLKVPAADAVAKASPTSTAHVDAAARPTAAHPATDPHAHRSLPTMSHTFGIQMVVIWGLLAAALYAVPSFLAKRLRRSSRASDARRGPRHMSVH